MGGKANPNHPTGHLSLVRDGDERLPPLRRGRGFARARAPLRGGGPAPAVRVGHKLSRGRFRVSSVSFSVCFNLSAMIQEDRVPKKKLEQLHAQINIS